MLWFLKIPAFPLYNVLQSPLHGIIWYGLDIYYSTFHNSYDSYGHLFNQNDH